MSLTVDIYFSEIRSFVYW